MANRPPFEVTKEAQDLRDGLVEGNSYYAQNGGGTEVYYVNFATDPTDEDVAWNILAVGDFIIFDAEAANPVWVRVTFGGATMVISDG